MPPADVRNMPHLALERAVRIGLIQMQELRGTSTAPERGSGGKGAGCLVVQRLRVMCEPDFPALKIGSRMEPAVSLLNEQFTQGAFCFFVP